MSGATIAVMIIIGLLLVLFEIFILPGITIAGTLGTLIVGVGIYQSYMELGMMMGHITLVCSGLAMILSLVISYKTASHMALDYTLTSRVNEKEENEAGKSRRHGYCIWRYSTPGKSDY